MKPRFSLKKYGVITPIKVSVNEDQFSPASVVRNNAVSLEMNPILSFTKYELEGLVLYGFVKTIRHVLPPSVVVNSSECFVSHPVVGLVN